MTKSKEQNPRITSKKKLLLETWKNPNQAKGFKGFNNFSSHVNTRNQYKDNKIESCAYLPCERESRFLQELSVFGPPNLQRAEEEKMSPFSALDEGPNRCGGPPSVAPLSLILGRALGCTRSGPPQRASTEKIKYLQGVNKLGVRRVTEGLTLFWPSTKSKSSRCPRWCTYTYRLKHFVRRLDEKNHVSLYGSCELPSALCWLLSSPTPQGFI